MIDYDKLKNIWNNNITNKDTFQIYLHNPFCKKVCSFCAYGGYKYNKQDYDFYYKKYLPELIKKYYSIINLFKNQHYWIGTPNIMKTNDMNNIFSLLSFDKIDNHKTIEVHPSLLTFEQIDIFKYYNINTIVIGVQTFNKNILDAHNRISIDIKRLKKLIEYAHSRKMFVVVDLLVLEGSNSKLFYNDLDIISKFNVDEIVAAYDYKWKGNSNINENFVNVINKFIKESNYKKQDNVINILDWMNKKNGIQLTLNELNHDDIIKYTFNTKITKNKPNISTLGIGSWNNVNIYSTINTQIEYYTKMVNREEFLIKNEN